MIIFLIALVVITILSALQHLLPISSNGHGHIHGSRDEDISTAISLLHPPRVIHDVPFVTCVPTVDHALVNRHHGQRKLLVAEIELLTHACLRGGCMYFVYAGSAPGIHIGQLITLFPSVTFILVDPNEFNISVDGEMINYPRSEASLSVGECVIYLSSSSHESYPLSRPKKVRGIDGHLYDRGHVPRIDDYVKAIHDNEKNCRVFIIEEMMTRTLARHLRDLSSIPVDGSVDDGRSDILFMSDIRTNSGDEEDDRPTDGDLLWNMAQMFVWVAEMRPLYYSHKHRPILFDPVIEDYMIPDVTAAKEFGLDLLHDRHTFLGGDVFLQAWTSKHSPETRMVGMRGSLDVRGGSLDVHGGSLDVRGGSLDVHGGSSENICNYLPIPEGYKPKDDDGGRYITIPGTTVSYPIATTDLIAYDQKMLYHNRINRGTLHYRTLAKKMNGIDDCYDCARESAVWDEYYREVGITPTEWMIAETMISVSRSLVREPRGDMRNDIARLHKKLHKTSNSLHVHTRAVDLLSRHESKKETISDDRQGGSGGDMSPTSATLDVDHTYYHPANQ